MIEFINKRYNRVNVDRKGFKVINSQVIDVTTLGRIVESSNDLIFTDLTENFKITNKGGCRFINYLKVLIDSAGSVYAFYDSAKLSYLMETEPAKLYNYSESSVNKLLQNLSSKGVVSWTYDYDTGTLIPKDFESPEYLFQWLLNNESELCVKVFNQIKELKTTKNLIDKDLKFFSDELSAISEITSKYNFKDDFVMEAFSSYTLL